MAQRPRSSVADVEESTYRCPGCGQIVDSRRIDEVLEHHQHVLHRPYPPQWFTARDRMGSSTARGETLRPAVPERSPPSAAVTSRRYGHY